MSPDGSSGLLERPHSGYQHEAFYYRTQDEFLAGTVPFVQDAVARAQPVMVALIKPQLEAVRDAVGECGGDVSYVDMGRLGANPARIIPGWRAFIDDHGDGDQPLRGIGEPQWPGRRAEEALECQLHEALLNVAVAPDTPLWLRCPYDVAELPEPLIEASSHSHPALIDDGRFRGSTCYEGLQHVEALFGSPLPAPPPDCDTLTLGATLEGEDLDAVRRRVFDHAAAAGMSSDRTQNLVIAVSGLARHSVRSDGRAELRLWTRPDAVIVEMQDGVRRTDPMAGRRAPAVLDAEQPDRALWIANQLCDLVQVRVGATGSLVRVFAWR